jgi:DNA-binding PadR family transcriptional regulator
LTSYNTLSIIDRMKRTIGLSALELSLLGILDQNPCSGYDLRKRFVSSPFRHFSDSPGSIYPALRRLTARGWIDAQAPAGSRKRQVFAISKKGRAAFVAWLRRPVIQDAIFHPELILLRFAFMSQALPQTEVQAFLEEFENAQKDYIVELEDFFTKNRPFFPLTGRLSLECGLEEYRTRLLWTKHARQAISRSKKWPLA